MEAGTITRDTKPRFLEAKPIRNRQVGGSNPPGGSTPAPSRNANARRGFYIQPNHQIPAKKRKEPHRLPDTESDTGRTRDTQIMIKHSHRKKEKR